MGNTEKHREKRKFDKLIFYGRVFHAEYILNSMYDVRKTS